MSGAWANTYLSESRELDNDWTLNDTLSIAYGTSQSDTIVLDVGTWYLTINGNLVVGHNRKGELNLGTGNVSVIPASNNVGTYIGNDGTAVGVVNVDGGTFTAGGAKPFYIGQTGEGTLNLNSGSVVSTNEVYIGNNAGGVGVVNVNGGHFDARKHLYVGVNGTGTLNLNGGTVDVANDLNVGEGSGSGTINGISGDLHQNGSWNVFNVGKGANSTGTVIKEGGDWSCNYLRIGTGSGSTGSFTQNGGTMTVTTELSVGVGNKSTGSFTINSGSVTLTGNNFLTIGRTTGSTATMTVGPGGKYTSTGNNVWGLLVGWDAPGTLNIAGGEVETRILSLCNTVSAANSEVNITDGGVLVIDYVKYTGNTRDTKVNFDGGKMKRRTQSDVSNTFFDANANVTVSVGAKGAEFDANGYDIAINEALENKSGEAGKVRFCGGGSITLGGANTYTGGTTIELGTKVVAGNVDAKNAIVSKLVIDGRAVLEEQDYTVLEYADGLTEADLANISFTNCAAETTSKIVDGNKIVVTLAAATCVPKTSNKIKVFEDMSLDDIAYGTFSARMCGGFVGKAFNAVDSAKGYNKKLFKDEYGNLTSIVVEFQVRDGSNTKCVVVEFTDDGSSVYASGLGTKYSANAIGYEFYEQNGTWQGSNPSSNINNCYAETIAAAGYGVCDIRVKVQEATELTLDRDMMWSELRNGAEIDSDSVLRILVSGENPVLTINENVNVAKIHLVNGSVSGAVTTSIVVADDATLSYNSFELGNGVCLSVAQGDFAPTAVSLESGARLLCVSGEATCAAATGSGTIEVASDATFYVDGNVATHLLNNGTVVKRVAADVTIPFDNDSTGLTIVSNGTLKVASNAGGDGTDQTVRVKEGATFDLNGVRDVTVNVILEEGAEFANSGADIADYAKQTVKVTLEGNATATFAGNFGLLAFLYGETKLDLGSKTLTLNGPGKNFWLCNTAITGTGTIRVKRGFLNTTSQASIGEDCTLEVPNGGALILNADLTVKNFVNGTINNIAGNAMLTVKGTLTPGTKAIPKLTLASGATVKATGTAQVVSTEFSASGTITVDASDITAAAFREAGEAGIPVLTVPDTFDPSSVEWNVANSVVNGVRTKWRTDAGGNTKRLYIARSSGLMVIIR